MDKIYTLGAENGLNGEVELSGSKNATVAIMAAALLASDGQVVLSNVPDISDAHVMAQIIGSLGVVTRGISPGVLSIDASTILRHEAPYELIGRIRASFSVLGPILARVGRARVALPGGCDIGARPVDFHLKGLEAMGVQIGLEHGFIEACAPNGLHGAEITLQRSSVGATTHLMAAAALAKGVTKIFNAAIEPDVVACAAFVNALGGRVRGAGSRTIEIEGVRRLCGAPFRIDADRIEAGTFAAAAAATGGDVFLRGAIADHLRPTIEVLAEAGAEVAIDSGGIRVRAPRRLRAVSIQAAPHPGFPTDLQPPFAAMLALADGTSTITETVYERRFKYIDELTRMGADSKISGNSALITGVGRLTGAPVSGSDLRATAALVLAGLLAEGQSEIAGVQYLDRGYERFVQKLQKIGARVWRSASLDVTSPSTGDGGHVLPADVLVGSDSDRVQVRIG